MKDGSVEIGTAEEEAALRADQLAAVVAQLRGAVWANLHDFSRRQRLGWNNILLVVADLVAHKDSSHSSEYMSSPSIKRRSERNCGGKNNRPVPG